MHVYASSDCRRTYSPFPLMIKSKSNLTPLSLTFAVREVWFPRSGQVCSSDRVRRNRWCKLSVTGK